MAPQLELEHTVSSGFGLRETPNRVTDCRSYAVYRRTWADRAATAGVTSVGRSGTLVTGDATEQCKNGRMRTYRVVSLTDDGKIRSKDYKDLRSLLRNFEQSGIEEDSYTMSLHGEPVLKGLVGPMSEGRNIVRYETPKVFALLTEFWSKRNGQLPKLESESDPPASSPKTEPPPADPT